MFTWAPEYDDRRTAAPYGMKGVSCIEQQRDFEWFKKLVMEELELCDEEAVRALVVAVAITRKASCSIFMQNYMVAAMGVLMAGEDPTFDDIGFPADLQAMWRKMTRRAVKYLEMMGRIPAGAKKGAGRDSSDSG